MKKREVGYRTVIFFRSAKSNVGFFKSGFTTADLNSLEKIPDRGIDNYNTFYIGSSSINTRRQEVR